MIWLVLLLVWSGTLTVIYGITTPVRAWKSMSWVLQLGVFLVAVFFDLVFLDALNLIPGVF